MVAVTKNKKGDKIQKIFISETTGPIGTKLWSQVAKWFQRRTFLVIVYGRTTDET
jgi:hypothetical protein